MFAPDGRPAGAALAYEGCGNQRRGRADAFNKVKPQMSGIQCAKLKGSSKIFPGWLA